MCTVTTDNPSLHFELPLPGPRSVCIVPCSQSYNVGNVALHHNVLEEAYYNVQRFGFTTSFLPLRPLPFSTHTPGQHHI